jgi:hypothetical protein
MVTIAFIFAMVVLLSFINLAYNKAMRVHCSYLVIQSQEYEDYYVTALDKEECLVSYGIEINAPTALEILDKNLGIGGKK